MQRSRGRGHSGTHRRGATRPPTSSPGSCQEACAAKPEEPADPTLLDALKGQRERVARLVDAVAETGGSAALTARLKDEEAKLHGLETKLAASQARRPPPKRATDVVRLARAFVREAAELLGLDRDTTRATLVAMLEPMRLTPGTDGPADFYEVSAKMEIPAIQGDGREVLKKTGCGGAICALEQTFVLAVSADLSRIRGLSGSEEVVRVKLPRLLLEP